MIKADVYYRKSDHVNRIMTGLHLLETQSILQCNYIEDIEKCVLPGDAAVEIRINGKRIAFDMCDASLLNQAAKWDYLTAVDMYFERSHQDWSHKTEYVNHLHKIRPFGFNYYTTYPGNPAYAATTSGNFLKKTIRNFINSSRHCTVEAFEGKANYKAGKKPKIIFMTRLWDPDDIKIRPNMSAAEQAYIHKRMEERKKINADRIEICRRLSKIYGKAFRGGIQYSKFAATQCPDVILPIHMTLKGNYLRLMKGSDICIGSAGLEKSIGWKTGEYVAAARAIVCEEPAYLLPGSFEQGVNYLTYDDVDSCIAAVEKLYQNPESIYQMQLANERYYKDFLRPETQILNALRQCNLDEDI